MSERQTPSEPRSTSQVQVIASEQDLNIAVSMKDAVEKKERYFNPSDRINIYGNLPWHKANSDARTLLTREPPVLETGEPTEFRPIGQVEKAYDFVMERYLEYVFVLKMMATSMKRLLHPQKRLLFKKFIEAVACRVCELKNEMIKLGSTNIHNLVGCYTDLGMVPDDIEYNIPFSIAEESWTSIKLRERQLSLILNGLGNRSDQTLHKLVEHQITKENEHGSVRHSRTAWDNAQYKNKDVSRVSSSTTPSKTGSTISALGNLGKGRSGSFAQDLGGSSSSRRKQGSVAGSGSPATTTKPAPPPPTEVELFTTSLRYKIMLNDPKFFDHIQLLYRQWLFWCARKATQKIRMNYDTFIHMNSLEDINKVIPSQTEFVADQVLQHRQERDAEYQEGLASLQQEYPSSSEGDFDLWALHLNLQQWVLELRDLLGKCGPYPDEDAGGCQALFTNKTVAEVAEELESFEENEKTKKSAGKDKDKDKKGKDDKKKKEEDKNKKKKAVKEEFSWIMPRSIAIPEMMKVLEQYNQYWNTKLEMDNLQQRMDLQLAKETVRTEAEEKIRKMVDALMRTELDRMRAIDREPPPKPDKKGKRDKKAKKKGKKDPLGNKTIEELYSELVMAEIVVRPKQVTLDDYIGAPNLSDTPKRDVYRLATPHDIKMALREMFGLPLCSRLIHTSVELRKSVLLAGPSGVGKNMLVHGLCRETGANLIDLSPIHMVGKYQGKKQEAYLLNVLLKVAKAMEPTIILVNKCHLLFPTKKAKKIPAVTKDKPARWIRLLTRLMKKVVVGDRILLIGVTNNPFTAKTSAMSKLFQNPFLVPFPEYGTRHALWTQFLDTLKLAGPHRLNLSLLTKMTEGFAGGDIEKVIKQVCTASRQASKRRLCNAEMIPALVANHPDDNAPNLADWVTWYLTTPLMAARRNMINELVESEEAAAAAASKKR